MQTNELFLPEDSKWVCYIFGSTIGNGIHWRPLKGKEPNFFWRWMQYICFGNRWVKSKKEKLSVPGDTPWQSGKPDKKECKHVFINDSDYCINCEGKNL